MQLSTWIVFFLAEGQDDREMFSEKIKAYPDPLTIYVLCDNAPQIKQVVSEAIALGKIQTERAELKSDPVSQRNLFGYIKFTSVTIGRHLVF